MAPARFLWSLALLAASLSASAQGTANAARIVLLLPAHGSRFGDAGDAIRRGFMAARQVAGDATPVDVVETDESSSQLAGALARVRESGAAVIVGPLTRDGVNLLVDAKRDDTPLVTLNVPDRDPLPASMLAFGFPIEQEARQVARTALGVADESATSIAPGAAQRLLIVVGHSSFDHRISDAFRRALIELGQQPEIDEVTFDAGGLTAFGGRERDRAFEGVFLALSPREAAQVRPRMTRAAKFWATSQVNPGGLMAQAMAGELAGVRFVDMPWLLEPAERRIAAYPRLQVEEGTPPPAVETERLYALGIDAYRVAKIWSTGSTQFELAGVTGRLAVDRARSPRVERFPVFGVFRAGRVQREEPGP